MDINRGPRILFIEEQQRPLPKDCLRTQRPFIRHVPAMTIKPHRDAWSIQPYQVDRDVRPHLRCDGLPTLNLYVLRHHDRDGDYQHHHHGENPNRPPSIQRVPLQSHHLESGITTQDILLRSMLCSFGIREDFTQILHRQP
jgi:hypothetical protein